MDQESEKRYLGGGELEDELCQLCGETIAQEAKRLLESVPDFADKYGILDRIYPDHQLRNVRYQYLKAATNSLDIEHVVNHRSTLLDVIDGNCYSSYPQETAKGRFGALLDNLIAAGY